MDLDDELLGLAEGTTTKRKSKSSSKSKSSKRKRPTAHEDSASDMDMSSEDDDAPPSRKAKRGGGDDEDEDDMLFPLEGKYKDDADRRYIQGLNEIEREAILADRQEKISEQQQRIEVRQMVKNKERAEGGRGGDLSDEDDDEPLRTGRNRKATGTTNEKSASLAELKQRRAEKGKKKEKKQYSDDEADSSPRRRGDSPDDAYTEDESDVDRDDFAAAAAAVEKRGNKKAAELVGPTQFKDLVVPRTKLAEFCAAPWFEEWVEGAWVRFLIGADDRGQPTYRLCEVLSVKEVPEEPYRIESANTALQLELRFAKNVRFFKMENVSNSAFTDHEFGRLARQLEFEKMHLPTTNAAAKIEANLDKHKDYIMTEADVAAVLAKKGARVNPAAGKARLIIQRDFARQTGDQTLLDEVNASLALLEGPAPLPGSSETEQERMRRVNERNRATNREEIKKAEGKAQDERRRQAAALARGDQDVKVDPSARVKTMTRLHYDRETPSRPSTPTGGASSNGAAAPTAADVAVADSSRAKGSKFEERVAALADVEVDLDF